MLARPPLAKCAAAMASKDVWLNEVNSRPLDSIVQELRRFRPSLSNLGFGAATVDDCVSSPLRADEASLIEGSRSQRRREFWAGRAAAHRAVSDLGATDGSILCDGRRPRFPSGLTGSISHSGGVAVAIAAPIAHFTALGIDLELRILPASAWRLVLGHGEPNLMVQAKYSCTEVFSAKEAAFKALDSMLNGGAPPLRQIFLDPVEGGFKVGIRGGVREHLLVSTHRLSTGIFSWMAVSTEQQGTFCDSSTDMKIGTDQHDRHKNI